MNPLDYSESITQTKRARGGISTSSPRTTIGVDCLIGSFWGPGIHFLWLHGANLGYLMAGKQAVIDHEGFSQGISICSYASFFLNTSIRIMATDRRFFPSHLVGDTQAGSGHHKKTSSPTTPYGKTGDGSPIGLLIGGDFASAPKVLRAELLFSAKAGLQPSQRTCVIHNAVHLTSREMTI
jgi:hypothetical protein